MKFGHQLEESAIPEWRCYYLNYKALKKVVKHGMFDSLLGMSVPNNLSGVQTLTLPEPSGTHLQQFVEPLKAELSKVDKFFTSQLSVEVSNVSSIEDALRDLTISREAKQVEACTAYRQQVMRRLMEQIVLALQRVQHLEKFAHQNEEGCRKIVKKFNKLSMCGTTLSHNDYVQGRSFHSLIRRIPLVNIRDGVRNMHMSLTRLLSLSAEEWHHPLTDSRAITAPPLKSPTEQLQGVGLETLQQHFHRPLKDVAKQFGVCVTVFKRHCRSVGIKRWPARKVQMIQAKKAKLCHKIGIDEASLKTQATGCDTADPTGERMLQQLQMVADDSVPLHKRRVKIWDKRSRRKITGMAAPLEINIERYLREHPDRERYSGQDCVASVQPMGGAGAVETPQFPTATTCAGSLIGRPHIFAQAPAILQQNTSESTELVDDSTLLGNFDVDMVFDVDMIDKLADTWNEQSNFSTLESAQVT